MIVLKHMLYAYAALLAITNPIGAVPVFLSVTHGISLQERVRIAKKVMVTVFLTLITFALIGGWIFSFFGSSVDAFSIAGGFCSSEWPLTCSVDRFLRSK